MALKSPDPPKKLVVLEIILKLGSAGPGTIEAIIKQRGLKIVHQNRRGLFKSLDMLIALFSGKRNIIITLSEKLMESQSIYKTAVSMRFRLYQEKSKQRERGWNSYVYPKQCPLESP